MPLGVIVAVAMLAQMVTLIGVKARSATPFLQTTQLRKLQTVPT